MELYVFKHGLLNMPQAVLFKDPNGVVDIHSPEFYTNTREAPVPYYLIKLDDNIILYDTGNYAGSPDPMPEDEHPIYCLEQMGIKPEDVTHVIQSHLHIDHIGNLKSFTNAKIYVQADEFAHAKAVYDGEIDDNLYPVEELNAWFDVERDWCPVPGEWDTVEIFPGLELVLIGKGHTFGMLGLLVRLEKSKNVIIASDSIYCRGNVEPEITLPGICDDEAGYEKNIRFMLKLAEENDADIWFGHDMEQYEKLIHWNEGYYE